MGIFDYMKTESNLHYALLSEEDYQKELEKQAAMRKWFESVVEKSKETK